MRQAYKALASLSEHILPAIVSVMCIGGIASSHQQLLSDGPRAQIVIGTPGRMFDTIFMRKMIGGQMIH